MEILKNNPTQPFKMSIKKRSLVKNSIDYLLLSNLENKFPNTINIAGKIKLKQELDLISNQLSWSEEVFNIFEIDCIISFAAKYLDYFKTACGDKSLKLFNTQLVRITSQL